MTQVALVTIAHGRHDHLRAQHQSLARSSRLPDEYVVVAMDDQNLASALDPLVSGTLAARVLHIESPGLGLPLAAARNRGVESALEAGADVVVCLDVDCLAGVELVAAYAAIVGREPDTVWSGPVTYLPPPPGAGYDLLSLDAMFAPHPARPSPARGEATRHSDPDLFWSLSFAISQRSWEQSGGFCEEYIGYGGEDTDYGRVLAHRGVGLGWVGAARAYHQHHAVSRPPVEHLDDILRNGATFRRRWGTWPMTGWLEDFQQLGLVEQRGGDWMRAGTNPNLKWERLNAD